MQGHFDLTMLHTPGLTQELIEAVRREGGDPEVERYIKSFQQDGEWHGDNLVFQTYPSYLFYKALSAASMYFSTQYQTTPTALQIIQLSSASSEPAYSTENTSNNYTFNGNPSSYPNIPTGAVDPGFWKYFTSCIVTPDIKSDAAGREAIYGKWKWLFLPGECTSGQIKSISVWYDARPYDPTYGGGVGKAHVARIRIKDSGGNPVTINKIATKSLLIEYTFTLVSI